MDVLKLNYKPFSTSFLALASVVDGLALGAVCGFNDKSLIDGKLSRAVSLSDIFGRFAYSIYTLEFFSSIYVSPKFKISERQ